MVIRTVWIAAFCLAGLGGLFATRVTASISEQAVRDLTTVGISLPHDALAKADKLQVIAKLDPTYTLNVTDRLDVIDTLNVTDKLGVTYLRYPVEITPVVPTEPVAAEMQPTKPSARAKAGSSHADGIHARRIAVLLPKPRPRFRPAKNAKDVGVTKAAVDMKPCHQQDGLGGMLISLSGLPRCEL